MKHLLYFESIIYGQVFDDKDLQMVEDLLTELDDLGLSTRIWTNDHRGIEGYKKIDKLSIIEIEVDSGKSRDFQPIESSKVVNSRMNKINDYLINNGWDFDFMEKGDTFLFIKYIRQ